MNEFISTCFKKISKNLGFNSVQVILEFLKEDLNDEKKDIIIEEDEEDVKENGVEDSSEVEIDV